MQRAFRQFGHIEFTNVVEREDGRVIGPMESNVFRRVFVGQRTTVLSQDSRPCTARVLSLLPHVSKYPPGWYVGRPS